MKIVKQYINGEYIAAQNTANMPLLNPATEIQIAEITMGSQTETIAALNAAKSAFGAWKNTNPWERAEILKKTAELIRTKSTELGAITTLESGKLLHEGKGEWIAAAQLFEWFAEEGKRSYGQVIPAARNNKRTQVIYQPMGVIGIITAWNFPVWNLARAWAAALAAGNCIVCKPSEETPLSAVALIDILQESGMPIGVVNMVVGDAPAIGQTMLESDICKKMHFVGSTRVGKILMDGASQTNTKLSLELGGNAPVIISQHCDWKSVAKISALAKSRNCGQVCVSPQRFIIHESIYDDFILELTNEFGKMAVGDASQTQSQIAPLISKTHRNRIKSLVEDAVKAGARLVCGGEIPDTKGYFYSPTILADIKTDNPIFRNEVFGPVISATKFSSKEQAVQLANDSEYGLAAYIWSNDLYETIYYSENIEAGIVGINEFAAHGTEAPFGGWKQSGTGHECGQDGLLEYLEKKVISIGNI